MASARGQVVRGETATFISGGVAIMVATRDDEMRPEITRGWGPGVAGDGRSIRVNLIAPPGSRTRENLEANGSIAMNCTLPSSYRAVQAKGTVLEAAEPGEGDLARVNEHADSFTAETAKVGAPAPAHLYVRAVDLTVTFEVEELYDQTPGPAAGGKL